MDKFDFSLIVPCFNEERILEDSVRLLVNALSTTTLKYEVIFIDDKSSDNTVKLIKEILKEYTDWRIIEHSKNRGRGYSVSEGIKIANAPIVGFIDIDLSTSPWYLPRLIYEVQNGSDIATAARFYKVNPRTIFRWVLSKGYGFLMRLVLSCNLQDTETGCKVFNKKRIMPILDEIKEMHWFWDTEIMIYSYVRGYKIVEVPTLFIRERSFTTVRIFRDTIDYFMNIFKFRKRIAKIRRIR
jgi:glycosyltransferase involved in cell wall biosynthesis